MDIFTKDKCPLCGSENIFYSKKTGIYKCEECGGSFERPETESSLSERVTLGMMIDDTPTFDIIKTEVFLASSVDLKLHRDMISSIAAERNGNSTFTYIKLFHCEDDDVIERTQTQQESYNKKISECDIFALIIDNGSLGEFTEQELFLAAEQKRLRGIKMAAFVREWGEGNLRWKKFIAENRSLFDFYYEYTDTCDIPALAKKLFDEIPDDGSAGTKIYNCFRYTHTVILTASGEKAKEYVYALGDKFNTKNNENFDRDCHNFFIFRIVLDFRPWEEPQGKDHIFVISEGNDRVTEIIRDCFERQDGFIDINLFEDKDGSGTEELAKSISEKIGGRYIPKFSDRSSLLGKKSINTRTESISRAYYGLIKGIRLFVERNYHKALPELEKAAEAGINEACFYLGQIYGNKEPASFYNAAAAEKYYRMAADSDGHKLSCIGDFFLKEGMPDEAEKYYRRAADTGDTLCPEILACFLKERQRYREAAEVYAAAADKGSMGALDEMLHLCYEHEIYDGIRKAWRIASYYEPEEIFDSFCDFLERQEDGGRALHCLGIVYEEKQEIYKAEEYYRMAADKGNPSAQYSLGCMLMTYCRFDEAEECFKDAADKGIPEAQYDLAMLLLRRKNIDEAKKYLLAAADNGHVKAAERLAAFSHIS